MKLHMTKNGLGWCKAIPITEPARIRALIQRSKMKLVASIPRSLTTYSNTHLEFIGNKTLGVMVTGTSPGMPGSSVTTATPDVPNGSASIQTTIGDSPMRDALSSLPASSTTQEEESEGESIMEVDSLGTSIDMMHIVDPTFGLVTLDQSPLVEIKEKGINEEEVPTVKLEASENKNITYLTHALQVVCEGDHASKLKNKHAFTIEVSDHIKSMSSAELGEKLAEYRMAQQRTCTSFAKQFDESMACDGGRVEQMLAQLDKLSNGKACEIVSEQFNALKLQYTNTQWDKMIEERTKYLARINSKSKPFEVWEHYGCTASRSTCKDWSCLSRERNKWLFTNVAVTTKQPQPPPPVCAGCCGNVEEVGVLRQCETCAEKWCDGCFDNDTLHWLRCKPEIEKTFVTTIADVDEHITKLLSVVATAPPTTIGMGRPVPLSGLEILTRLHVVLGHPPIDQLLATLAKTQNMRANVVTKADVEEFVKRGCIQCIMWKMRRSPVKPLTDATRAPIGKKWSYDTLSLKVKTTSGSWYLTRFLDDGSNKKRTYGHTDFTASTLATVLAQHRAWVRPIHGEIWVGRRDGHPSQRAQLFQDALIDGQTHDESTAPYRHEAMPVEVTWQHDVPGAMILLSTGPGSKFLRHFEAAFLCHEDANNRVVKPRTHRGDPVSADMLYYNDTTARANLLYAFWAPVMYLVYPEIRASKFNEHAHPGAYYGPSRETESDRYCMVWNGHRTLTCDKGCIRIDERQVISMSSRTNKATQPFTLSPDAPTQLPNFDQWTDAATEKSESQQLMPSVEDAELDADLTLTDADPTIPFIIFLHAGKRRIGEIGHYVRMLTKKRVRVVSIDPKRRGYAHNILFPRVLAWVKRLALLALCIAVIISGPCSPWTPLAMEKNIEGRTVLFDTDHPDGITAPNGSPHPLVEAALKLHELGFDVARDVHGHGGKVLIEHPVGHGKHSMWPIRGREKHSTLFDTTIFKNFIKDVPGDRVYTDQCMLGAATRKTTQWFCNNAAFDGGFKYLSVQCSEENTDDHPFPHTTSLVGKDEHGVWKSKGSDEYKPPLCRAVALAVLDGYSIPNDSPDDDPMTEHASGGGDDIQNFNDHGIQNFDDHGDNGEIENRNNDDGKDDDNDAHEDGSIAIDTVDYSSTTPMSTLAPDPPDPFPTGSRVDVFWTDPDQWHTGTITATSVWRGPKGQSRNPRRQFSITYDVDGEHRIHSLHETKVRLTHGVDTISVPNIASPPSAPAPRDDAAPGSPRPRPSTPVPRPQTPPQPTPGTNNRSSEPAPDSSKFVHHGEKVTAMPENVYQSTTLTDDEVQAQSGDLGTMTMASIAIHRTSNALTTKKHYSQSMENIDKALSYDSDLLSFVSHEFDIELNTFFNRRIISAVIGGEEFSIHPDEPKQWHTPQNERDYLRSPQRALWRTAKEKKMDQYLGLNVFKLVKRIDVKSRIMGSLWAYKIKFNEHGKFDKLNPRWCVKGYHMDKSIYVGFSEVCQTSSIKMMAALLAAYELTSFLFDCGNAFQATRTDNGTVKSEKLYCEQAPGFNVKDEDGVSMVCEILVALQGRVDAARLFGDRLEQIIFKLGGKRSTWDPKVYIFHFGPLVDTSASLDEVLSACAKDPKGTDKNGAPHGWATLAVHVDDCPGIGSSTRIIEYIKSGIMVQYECTHGPWKKVLGFNFTITDTSVSMSAEHTIESMYNTYLTHLPVYDARLPGRDVNLIAGEVPKDGDPARAAYLEMQSETRSLLGLLLWVSLAYPQISYQVNRACGFMASPSHDVNAYAKHIAMHLYHHPIPVTWTGGQTLELSQPSPPPFTPNAKEYGLHFAADAAPDDAARGITGGIGMLNGGVILTVSSRQHLKSPDMHAFEVLAAGTIMHKMVPLRGLLTEWRIPQELPTPLYIDSASTVFVAQSRGAVKKSAWIRRRAEVLQEAFDLGECMPIKIEEYNNIADPQTKYLTYKVWMRHLHYTHNLEGEPPPPIEKANKSKGPSTTAVLTKMEKERFLLRIGL